MERRSTGFVGKLLHSPKAWISTAVIGCVAVIALFAPMIAPYDPMKQDLAGQLKPPVFFGGSTTHLFGTDLHGRDILSRTMYGARVSLSLGILSVLLAAGVGVAAGMVSGYFGGKVDDIIMRAADVMLAFPPIVLAICIIALLKPSLSTVVIVLALVNWVWHARPVRSTVLRLRMLEYVSASRSLGASNLRILVRQIFPNVIPVIIVICTTQIGFMILLESALSFFGLTGSTLSWGWDIASGRDFISVAWWMSTMPGLVLFLTVMSLNMLGDWVRDITDPKMRGDVMGR
ncbi:MAG: ABC transporter permease [Candidatus Methylomirabilota bacterium]